jgi:hypothetical protein
MQNCADENRKSPPHPGQESLELHSESPAPMFALALCLFRDSIPAKIPIRHRRGLTMIRTILLLVAGLLALSLPVYAKGVCSTGAYRTCVACCKSHPQVSNRELCTYQCGDYKILERQQKKGN